MLHLQMKYTKYHNKKKSQPITKIVAVYSQFVVPQDEGFSVALPSKVSESPPPPPPSISINDVTLKAALK